MSMLSIRNVYHSYGQKNILSGLNLNIDEDETVCLLGASGGGKTTTLRVVAGFETPQLGDVSINGSYVSGKNVYIPPEKRSVGFLFQDYALFPHLTVAENILFGMPDRHSARAKNYVMHLLKYIDMPTSFAKYPATLSGGEQQRVALARAFAPQPKLILMDEPFSHLDMALRENMRNMTSDFLKQTGSASLIVTHDGKDGLYIADRVAIMKGGSIIQNDRPELVYQAPVCVEVAEHFGHINKIKGQRKQQKIRLACGEFVSEGDDKVVDVIIRQHDIIIGKGAKNHINFEAEIIKAKCLVGYWVLDIRLENGEVWKTQNYGNCFMSRLGKEKFHISPDSVMVF